MTAAQQHAWDHFGDSYRIEVERDTGDTSVAPGQSLIPAVVFGREAPLVVEIGTGNGEALLHAATAHPEMDFLGIEVYRPGLARAMLGAHKQELNNVRVIEANAPEVLSRLLPPACVQEIRVFFPDPWHKTRHHKRRLISPIFVEQARRVLAPGGLVRMATDWEEYAEHMRNVFDAHEEFHRSFMGDWAPRFAGRPVTNFERKGAAKGRSIRDLCYTLNSTSAASSV